MVLGDAIGEPGNAKPGYCSSGERQGIVCLEAPARINRNKLSAMRELPGFGSLHEGFMGGDLIWSPGRAMRFDIIRTCNEFSMEWPDALGEQIGVREIADADRAIKTFRHEVDEPVTVACVDMEPGVAAGHFREQGREVGRTERNGHGNAQAPAEVARGQDGFPGAVDLG